MIAVISDIHGNLPALQAVLQTVSSLGCARIISLGDIVGYYAQPGECIDLLREYGAVNIMGNHDGYLVNGTACPRSKMVADIMDYQRGIISAEQVRWLAESLPSLAEDGNYFAHGSWLDSDEYLYRVSAAHIPQDAINFFTGHTHVQALLEFGSRKYCNPGAVGQPRDGDPRAAFATLSGNEIALYRVAYDIEQTVFAMRKAGFPDRYSENLYIGAQIGGRVDKIVSISES
jgi:predicted phosphodiesterase